MPWTTNYFAENLYVQHGTFFSKFFFLPIYRTMNNKFSFPTSRNKIRKQVLSYFKSNNLYQNSCHNQIQLQSFQLKNKIQQRKLKSTANPFTHYPPTAQHLYNPTTMKGNTRSLSAQKAEFRKMVRT